jgi:hypothetical protein
LPPKQPRKKLAKSVSTILNSDDLASTQFAGPETLQDQEDDLIQTNDFEDTVSVDLQKKPRKTKPRDQTRTKQKAVKRATAAQSNYFARPDEPGKDDSAIDLGSPILDLENGATDAYERPESALPAPENAEAPLKSLAELITGFEYAVSDGAVPTRRDPTGEALTKRRRIELADGVAPEVSRKPPDAPPEPKPKKAKEKAPKKKPQTITSLATKAYEPVEVPPPAAQATVSSFFVAQKPDEANKPMPPGVDESASKPKKPRKPRVKKTDGGPGPGPAVGLDASSKTAKAKKVKKTKVRFNEDQYLAKLYAPEEARAEEKHQGFLFGTSSQLAADESPTFIRDMQHAMQQSEALSTTSMDNPEPKSCVKVPTAPRGTLLSLGQAERELWCSAARDSDGNILDLEIQMYATESPAIPDQKSPELPSLIHHTDSTAPGPRQVDAPRSAMQTQALPSDDSWMMLGSDDPPPVPSPNAVTPPDAETLSTTAPKRLATSPIRQRSVLQSLDVNVSPQKELPRSQHRAFATKATSTTEPKRPRGRPPKIAPSASTAATAPKKRGRPPKQKPTEIISDPPTTMTPSASTGMHKTRDSALPATPPKKRGRPPKPKPTPAAAIPTKSPPDRIPPSSSDFVHIDDVSESDSPTTPSPPRRRGPSSPPIAQQLTLEPISSPKAPRPTISGALLVKPDDARWASVAPLLFPQITAVVKAAPPASAPAQPLSWYEKILLYDPIVLEDLTAWLNGRGLMIEVRRVDKGKKKKGKEKEKEKTKMKTREIEKEKMEGDDEAPDGDGEVGEEDEVEVVREELKPWMVQKWCEENSVCCLWREGLRGGVKVKY